METVSGNNFVTWKSITPIFADVVISPWNLLIGSLLISNISISESLISILLGYTILGFCFYLYGNIGYKSRLGTDKILEPVFGKEGVRTIISGILALGQLGWFAIITSIGGESFAKLTGMPNILGITIFCVALFIITSFKLNIHGVIKAFISICSLALMLFLIFSVNTLNNGNIGHIISSLNFLNMHFSNICWGTSVVVASLVSFLTVSPDFLCQVKTLRDVKLSIILGIVLPGILICFLGTLIFASNPTLTLTAILSLTFAPQLAQIFNSLTCTDGTIALYTPAKRFAYALRINYFPGLVLSFAIGLSLTLLEITNSLEIWLSSLSAVYPSILGVTLAHYSLLHFGVNTKHASSIKSFGIVLFCSTFILTIQISLLGLSVGITAFILYLLMASVRVKSTLMQY